MNEATNSWADSWMSSQQALMKAMLPMPSKDRSASPQPLGPLQEQFDELQETWQESIANWTELLKDGASAPATPEALKDLFAPARWSGSGAGSLDAALRHVLEGPKYATLFDLDRNLLELQQLASRRDKDVAAFQAIVLKAWNTAFERFPAGAGKEGASPTTWRAMADQWLRVVNDTLIESQRSEAFVKAQSRMLRSASDYRLQERKIAEAWCEAFHVPTRTEMDELQHTVTDLRRQLRAMQRAASSAAGIKPAAPRPMRKRKASAKASSSVRT
jgi:polyhydroxyalkanoate synthesis regulator phasin